MDKDETIKEMAEAMLVACDHCEECKYRKYGALCVEAQQADKLHELGYRKIVSLRDFVVTAGELSTMREKAYNDARKETAKEISNWLHENCCYEEHYQLVDLFDEVFGVEVDE